MGIEASPPLVSIITPAYNAAGFISDAIESVRNQTYPHWEMVVADDGSSDQTAKIVADWAKQDTRIKLLQLSERGGVSRARNTSIAQAKGEYLSFLDSDDLWLPRKLEVQVAYMTRTGAAVCCSQYRRISSESPIEGHLIEVPKRITYTMLLKENTIGFLTAMLDRRQCGPIQFVEQGHEDYILWLSVLRPGVVAHGIQEDLARYRVSSSSLSSSKKRAARWMWNIYRNIEKLSLAESAWYFAHYALNGYKKHREL